MPMPSGLNHDRFPVQTDKPKKLTLMLKKLWLSLWEGRRATLVVRQLRFCASTAGGVGSVPGQGTKTPTCHTTWPKRKKKINFDFLSISVLELSVLCLVKSLFFLSKVITASMDMSLSKLWGMVKDRKARGVAVHRVTESQTQLSY